MNIEDIRRQLHLSDDIIALNAGSWGPLCQAARVAVISGITAEASSRGDEPDRMREKGSGLARYSEVGAEARGVLSRFLGSSPDEIALCDSTTTGMNVFLWGYDWKPGDEVIAGSLENPTAKVPLMILAKRRRVKLTYLNQFNGTLEQLSEKISEKTRMVLLSDINFATGSRIDLKKRHRG